MPPRKRLKELGRRESGGYLGLPHAVLKSPNYALLSSHAVKLLVDLGSQYRGKNNGDLCATWSILQPLGWRSRETLGISIKELLYYGFLEKTRQGGKRQCSLYALTWQPIDECMGKLDVNPSFIASALWKEPKPQFERTRN
jgi:hypothetical protein